MDVCVDVYGCVSIYVDVWMDGYVDGCVCMDVCVWMDV